MGNICNASQWIIPCQNNKVYIFHRWFHRASHTTLIQSIFCTLLKYCTEWRGKFYKIISSLELETYFLLLLLALWAKYWDRLVLLLCKEIGLVLIAGTLLCHYNKHCNMFPRKNNYSYVTLKEFWLEQSLKLQFITFTLIFQSHKIK